MKYSNKSNLSKENSIAGAFDVRQQEIELIEFLDNELMANLEFSKRVAKEFEETNKELNSPDNTNPYASREIKIKDLKYLFPEDKRDAINLVRTFILRSGWRLPAEEIHRDSTQYLMSYKNNGIIFVADATAPAKSYSSYQLKTRSENTRTDRYWNIVRENTWHFPKANQGGDFKEEIGGLWHFIRQVQSILLMSDRRENLHIEYLKVTYNFLSENNAFRTVPNIKGLKEKKFHDALHDYKC